MKDILDFIIEYNIIYYCLGVTLAIITFYTICWYLGKKMRQSVFLCIDNFLRNCHELDFYNPNHQNYSEYLPLYNKLKKRQKFIFYSSEARSFLTKFLEWFEMADSFINRMSSYMDYDHYFAHSEYLRCIENVDFNNSLSYFLTDEFVEYINKTNPESLHNLNDDKELIEKDFYDIPQRHNANFVKEELKRKDIYFDNVLPYPLDVQQRESIVKLEDNCLVISSAGSGKTSTTIGKIKYLVKKRNIDPKRILPITYTRRAADELAERLSLSNIDISCHTFHSLAFKIIADTTRVCPAICDESLMFQCLYNLVEKNEDFKKAVNSFLTFKSSLIKNLHDYLSPEQYYLDRTTYGIIAPFYDMDGKIIFTRSEEERKICTFLSLHNISFRYEEKYRVNTANETYRQYYPDFTIYFQNGGRTLYLILEHFAIDKNGNVPHWFGYGHEGGYEEANRKYNEGIDWKRRINRKNDIALIETTSAMFHDNTIWDKLTAQLQAFDVPMRLLTEDEQFERLVKRNKKMEDSLLNLITTFITLMKANRSTPEKILEVIRKENERFPDFVERSRFMIEEIFKPIFEEYTNVLNERGQIDYTDLILRATDICSQKLYKQEYDYILVDEFQDISVDRYHFIQSLRSEFPLTKLFCVGDDWQSIFRFSGSDLTLFNSFEEYFGYTERCKIEKTYRFGEPLISLSSDFILKNSLQVPKEIIPSNINYKTQLSTVEYSDKGNTQIDVLKFVIDKIRHDESIMLVGRYHSDAEFIPRECVRERDRKNNITKVCINRREIPFNTIHSAKGLEADHIILVNCSQDGAGFPSRISDDPILGYVLSKPEVFPFAEERRLFYVAITRAKKHVYILYKNTCPSQFITDIIIPKDGEKDKEESLECPWCKVGSLRIVNFGDNGNGYRWRIYRCTNNTAGCDYSWTVRFNDEESIPRQFKAMLYKSKQGETVDPPVVPAPEITYKSVAQTLLEQLNSQNPPTQPKPPTQEQKDTPNSSPFPSRGYGDLPF